jgi:hypothetical protein
MQRTLERAVELTWTMQDRTEEISEYMMEAHRDFARRDGHPAQTLGEMCTVAFKEGSAKRGPDEPFGDVFFGGIEGMQIGVALPLLEHELDLPAQPIGGADLVEDKLRAREIGGKVAGLVLLCVPGHDQACRELALPLHIEIERFISSHLGLQGRERLVAVAFDLAPLGGVDATDDRIQVAFGLDHEKAAFRLDRGQVGLIEKHPIAEKEPSGDRVRRRRVMHFGLAVGSERHEVQPLAQEIHAHMQLDRGRARLGEAPRIDLLERRFDAKGRAVVNQDMTELGPWDSWA